MAYFPKIPVLIEIKPASLARFFWQGFWGGPDGQLSMGSANRRPLWVVFRIYVGETVLDRRLSTVTPYKKTLPGAKALCQHGRRPFGDDTELSVQEIAFKGKFGIAGNPGGIAYAPAPFEGRDGARGVADFPALHLPGIRLFQIFLRHFGFSSGKIRTYKCSPGTFLDFLNFKPEKNRPEKFQSKFFCDFQRSRQKFSGPGNFTAKKSPGFRTP